MSAKCGIVACFSLASNSALSTDRGDTLDPLKRTDAGRVSRLGRPRAPPCVASLSNLNLTARSARSRSASSPPPPNPPHPQPHPHHHCPLAPSRCLHRAPTPQLPHPTPHPTQHPAPPHTYPSRALCAPPNTDSPPPFPRPQPALTRPCARRPPTGARVFRSSRPAACASGCTCQGRARPMLAVARSAARWTSGSPNVCRRPSCA